MYQQSVKLHDQYSVNIIRFYVMSVAVYIIYDSKLYVYCPKRKDSRPYMDFVEPDSSAYLYLIPF